jgi:hypothetical protein
MAIRRKRAVVPLAAGIAAPYHSITLGKVVSSAENG